jgi:antitoxin ParD1/3/4
MPTRNINLTPEQDAFVKEVVEAGEYQNASEVVRELCVYCDSAGRKTL